MQRAPSLLQLGKKKNLTGIDAGRALLICTAASARTGTPSQLPQNVAEYINTVLPYNMSEAVAYRAYLNACTYLSQQRALADAHAMRLFGYIVSQLKTIETSYALESALGYFFAGETEKTEEAYLSKAPFVGYGIEAYIGSLYQDSEYIISGALTDRANYDSSARIVASFNVSVKLIEEATGVKLEALKIDTAPFNEKLDTLGTYTTKLRELIQGADTPFRSEKLNILSTYFSAPIRIEEARITNTAVAEAREALKDLKIFETNEIFLVDILMKEAEDGI